MAKNFQRTKYYYDILNSLEEILKHFNIEYVKSDSYIQMPCPIHNGTNRTGCVVYLNSGVFSCYTNHCHTHYSPNVVGFIRGILSTQTGREVSTDEAVKFFLKNFYTNAPVTKETLEKRQFCDLVTDLTVTHKTEKLFNINISGTQEPSEYLIARGFPPELLMKYNIFTAKKSVFEGRTVVPIRHEYMKDKYSGFVARTPFDKCNLCNRYHANGPCGERQAKWLNNKEFKRQNHLYNFFESKEKITENGVILVTEGPLDCLRLVQHGVDCSVGIFGSSLSDQQSFIIEGASPRTILIGTDNDDAGNLAATQIYERFKRAYKCVRLKFPRKDLGELTKEEVEETVISQIERYKNKI